jgi:hypothetical protein
MDCDDWAELEDVLTNRNLLTFKAFILNDNKEWQKDLREGKMTVQCVMRAGLTPSPLPHCQQGSLLAHRPRCGRVQQRQLGHGPTKEMGHVRHPVRHERRLEVRAGGFQGQEGRLRNHQLRGTRDARYEGRGLLNMPGLHADEDHKVIITLKRR